MNSALNPKMSDSSTPDQQFSADRTLDITGDICPMTFVRTRLALDRLSSGQTLLVLLKGDEPYRNVPASARALGHSVLAESASNDGVIRLLLRKA
jgi:TusA-related sulfurtransferase